MESGLYINKIVRAASRFYGSVVYNWTIGRQSRGKLFSTNKDGTDLRVILDSKIGDLYYFNIWVNSNSEIYSIVNNTILKINSLDNSIDTVYVNISQKHPEFNAHTWFSANDGYLYGITNGQVITNGIPVHIAALCRIAGDGLTFEYIHEFVGDYPAELVESQVKLYGTLNINYSFQGRIFSINKDEGNCQITSPFPPYSRPQIFVPEKDSGFYGMARKEGDASGMGPWEGGIFKLDQDLGGFEWIYIFGKTYPSITQAKNRDFVGYFYPGNSQGGFLYSISFGVKLEIIHDFILHPDEDLVISPNPLTKALVLSNSYGLISARVLDSSGNEVSNIGFDGPFGEQEIDLSLLTTGTYTLGLVYKDHLSAIRFIIEDVTVSNPTYKITLDGSLITALAEQLISRIELFPNPSSKTITLSGILNLSHFKFFNSVGQCILNIDGPLFGKEIDISLLPNGIYVLAMTFN